MEPGTFDFCEQLIGGRIVGARTKLDSDGTLRTYLVIKTQDGDTIEAQMFGLDDDVLAFSIIEEG